MIEYLLKFYGIDCHYKWIGYFTTSLTLSIFSSLVFPAIYPKNFSHFSTEYLYKFLILTLCISKIITYFVVKHNLSKFFQLNNKLKKYQKKQLIGEFIFIFFQSYPLVFQL